MNCFQNERNYLTFLQHILDNGVSKSDRTGVGTFSVFGYDMRFDLTEYFPMLTTKKVHWKSIVHELLWFISGSTNIAYLQAHGVRIWNEWANESGELGPVYGHQWRSWPAADGQTIDQLAQVVGRLQTDPDSRRLLVSAWNVGQLDQMALPPCHLLFQFYVADNRLSCKLTQRSADAFLGVPFNIASYALLTHMVASVVGLGVGEFIWSGGDCHIYSNHLEQVKEQLSREPLAPPTLALRHRSSLDDFSFDDVSVVNYQSHPTIKAPIAV